MSVDYAIEVLQGFVPHLQARSATNPWLVQQSWTGGVREYVRVRDDLSGEQGDWHVHVRASLVMPSDIGNRAVAWALGAPFTHPDSRWANSSGRPLLFTPCLPPSPPPRCDPTSDGSLDPS